MNVIADDKICNDYSARQLRIRLINLVQCFSAICGRDLICVHLVLSEYEYETVLSVQ